jgi:hypothetical protein
VIEKKSTAIKKFVLSKITNDLNIHTILPYNKELWIVDLDRKEWYMIITSEGYLWYNSKKFDTYTNFFSLRLKELSNILRNWVELNLKIRINKVSKKNTELNYAIDLLLMKKGIFEIKNRYGFSYEVVKNYLYLTNTLQSPPKVKDFLIGYRI